MNTQSIKHNRQTKDLFIINVFQTLQSSEISMIGNMRDVLEEVDVKFDLQGKMTKRHSGAWEWDESPSTSGIVFMMPMIEDTRIPRCPEHWLFVGNCWNCRSWSDSSTWFTSQEVWSVRPIVWFGRRESLRVKCHMNSIIHCSFASAMLSLLIHSMEQWLRFFGSCRSQGSLLGDTPLQSTPTLVSAYEQYLRVVECAWAQFARLPINTLIRRAFLMIERIEESDLFVDECQNLR